MQDVFFAIGRFLEATFDMLLLPVTGLLPYGGLANWAIWGLVVFALVYWLRLQKKLIGKAQQDGTLV